VELPVSVLVEPVDVEKLPRVIGDDVVVAVADDVDWRLFERWLFVGFVAVAAGVADAVAELTDGVVVVAVVADVVRDRWLPPRFQQRPQRQPLQLTRRHPVPVFSPNTAACILGSSSSAVRAVPRTSWRAVSGFSLCVWRE